MASPSGWGGRLFHTRAVAWGYSALTEHALWAENNRSLLSYVPASPRPLRILELGAGHGVGTVALAEALGTRGHIEGLDFSATMIARARRRQRASGLTNLSFRQADATDLSDLSTGCIDHVLAQSFLYLVPDVQAVLRETRRVLKPGGRMICMEPRQEASVWAVAQAATANRMQLVERPASALRLGAAMAAWRAMSRVEGRRTEAELRALFFAAGFSKVEFSPTLAGLGHHVVAE